MLALRKTRWLITPFVYARNAVLATFAPHEAADSAEIRRNGYVAQATLYDVHGTEMSSGVAAAIDLSPNARYLAAYTPEGAPLAEPPNANIVNLFTNLNRSEYVAQFQRALKTSSGDDGHRTIDIDAMNSNFSHLGGSVTKMRAVRSCHWVISVSNRRSGA